MVNIFAFFSSKKKSKSKRASWDASTQAQSSAGQLIGSVNAASSSTTPAQRSVSRQTSRFLSLRTRSSSKMIESPQDALHRQSSTGSMRRKASRKDSVSTVLPKFGFEEEGRRDGGGGESLAGQLGISGSSLGLASLSGPPKLGRAEISVVDAVELSVDELRACWDLFGKALRDTGCDTVGLLLPQHQDPNPDIVHFLLALFILHHQPSLAPSLPSISSYTASRDPKPLYSDLLQTALADRPHPHELCDILKFSLQHLAPSQSPLVDSRDQIEFVRAEHVASYPLDAYASLLLPRLRPGVGACLDSIFELFSDIASKSEDNMTSGGKVCLLLGWWLCGDRKNVRSWEQVYKEWKAAGQRVEHLFYAWIRSQSIEATLPTRLIELVETYPFGESTLEDEELPSPPPSSFPRHTLAVYLETETRLESSTSSRDIIEAAIQGSTGAEVSLFAQLKEMARVDEDSKAYIDHIIALESQAFLKRFPRVELPGLPRFRGTEKESTLHPHLTPLVELSEEVASLAHAQANASSLDAPKANWDDFSKTGFGDAPERASKLDFTLAPSDRPLPRSSSSLGGDQSAFVPSASGPRHTFKAIREERIDIDDAFLPFIEETQLDKTSSIFNNIALVRLSTTAAADLTEGHGSPIEWLLLVVEHKPPAPVANSYLSPPSSSPSKESTVSKKRFSLGGFTSSFRRSTSGVVKADDTTTSTRKLVMGGSQRSGGLGSLAEGTGMEASVNSGLQVGEMGELLPREDQVSKTLSNPSQTRATLLSEASPPDDWHYIAEGGANLVFGYHGPSELYRNKALRIPKSPTLEQNDAETPIGSLWRQDLLPKLLDSIHLPESEVVSLEAGWVDTLLGAALSSRPDARTSDQTPSISSGSPVQATLMTDLRGGSLNLDTKVLAIEIKPKWGFLPAHKSIHPAEAAAIKPTVSRYRLHQHFRGVDTTYDPLDLYSGDEARMRTAISALWDLWETSKGQSNNWRVFVDGKAASPNEASDVPGNGEGSVSDRTVSLLLPVLLRSGVMNRLKTLQSDLDGTDISHLAQRFAAEHPNADLFDPNLMPELSSDELNNVISTYLGDAGSFVSDKCTLREATIAYALSATFKDCSIFITCPLRRTEFGWEVVESDAMVKVIDLDLKPVGNMRKWYDLDEKVWRHWQDTHSLNVSDDANRDTDQLLSPARIIPVPTSATEPTEPGSANDNELDTPAQPVRGVIPIRLNSASTQALFIPTPDRQLNDPMNNLDLTTNRPQLAGHHRAVSGVTVASTRALHSRTPDDSGHATPVGTGSETPRAITDYSNQQTPNPLSLADALALSPSMATNFATANREDIIRSDNEPTFSDLVAEPPSAPGSNGDEEGAGEVETTSLHSDHAALTLPTEDDSAIHLAQSLRPSTPNREIRSAGPSPSPGLINAVLDKEAVPADDLSPGLGRSIEVDDYLDHAATPSFTVQHAPPPAGLAEHSTDAPMIPGVDDKHAPTAPEDTPAHAETERNVPPTPSADDEQHVRAILAGVAEPEPEPVATSTPSELVTDITKVDSAPAPLEAPGDMPTASPEAQQRFRAILAGVVDPETDKPALVEERSIPERPTSDFVGQRDDVATHGGDTKGLAKHPATTAEEELASDRPTTPAPEDQQYVRAILAGVFVPEQEPDASPPVAETSITPVTESYRHMSTESADSTELVSEPISPSAIPPAGAIIDSPTVPSIEAQQHTRAILAGLADSTSPVAERSISPARASHQHMSAESANSTEHVAEPISPSAIPSAGAVIDSPTIPAAEAQQRVRAVLAGVVEPETAAETSQKASSGSEPIDRAAQSPQPEATLSPDTRSNTPFFTPMTMLEDTEPVYPEAVPANPLVDVLSQDPITDDSKTTLDRPSPA